MYLVLMLYSLFNINAIPSAFICVLVSELMLPEGLVMLILKKEKRTTINCGPVSMITSSVSGKKTIQNNS